MKSTGTPNTIGLPVSGTNPAAGAGNGKRARKRHFLASCLLTLSMGYGVGLMMFWGIQPRLESYHPALALAAAGLFFGVSAALFFAVSVVASSLYLRRCWPLGAWMGRRLNALAPWLAWAGLLLGTDRQTCVRSAQQVCRELDGMERQARSHLGVVLIHSMDLPAALKSSLHQVCAEWNLDWTETDNRTAAMAYITKHRPGAAICIGNDLRLRVSDLSLDYLPTIYEMSPEELEATKLQGLREIILELSGN